MYGRLVRARLEKSISVVCAKGERDSSFFQSCISHLNTVLPGVDLLISVHDRHFSPYLIFLRGQLISRSSSKPVSTPKVGRLPSSSQPHTLLTIPSGLTVGLLVVSALVAGTANMDDETVQLREDHSWREILGTSASLHGTCYWEGGRGHRFGPS